jgi:hypothetical protein
LELRTILDRHINAHGVPSLTDLLYSIQERKCPKQYLLINNKTCKEA